MTEKKEKYGKKELNAFRKLILQQINETKEIIDHKVSSSKKAVGEDSGETHHEEMGTENSVRELDFYLAEREGKFISNLENSLKRIEDETYGVCRGCGCLIDKKRLEIVPHATLCITCKNNKERKD